MHNDGLSPDAFLKDLSKLIQSTKEPVLREGLLHYSQALPPHRRLELLQILSLPLGELQGRIRASKHDASLLADVAEFCKTISKGGYDHSLDIANPDDIPAWVDDLDVLFDRSAEVFKAGDMKTAAKAYEGLFESLQIAEEIALEHNLYSAQEMLLCDLDRAKASYFRALYEVSPPAKAPAVIFHAALAAADIGNHAIGIAAMKESHESAMPSLPAFLNAWSKHLARARPDETPPQRELRLWLLREAVFLKDGLKGLEKLAAGPHAHVELFYHLAGIYLQRHDLDQAAATCHLGISRLSIDHEKAVLTDWLAQIALQQGNTKLCAEQRRAAWRLEPTHLRLVEWCAATKSPQRKQLQEELILLSRRSPVNVRLVCMIELILGDLEVPRRALLAADPLGWTPDNHPGPVILPALLLIASGLRETQEATSLHEIVEDIKPAMLRMRPAMPGQEAPPSYSQILLAAWSRRSRTPEQIDTLLASVRTVILDRIRALVHAGFEQALPKAIHMAVACAETYVLVDRKEEGLKFLASLRETFIRQTELRGLLRSHINASSVLPALGPTGLFIRK